MSALRSGRGGSVMRSLFVVAGALGAAASIFSVACSDDASPPFEPEPDAAVDAPVTQPDAQKPDAADAAADPDARGPYDPRDVPVVCDGSPCATQITAGKEHFCARMSDGTVRCWGSDAFGLLGTTPGKPTDGGVEAGSTVHVIPDLTGVTQISAAELNACARLDDGKVKCWGNNNSAQLGLNATRPVSDSRPHPVPSLVPIEAASRVEMGRGYACAVLATGKLWCWGDNSYGQLLRGDNEEAFFKKWEPGHADTGTLAPGYVSLSDKTVLGLTAEGQVWMWGALGGDDGLVAGRIGSVSPVQTPKRLDSLEKVTSLVASPVIQVYPSRVRGHACALANGEIYCWGRSFAGAIGTGVPGEQWEPGHAPFDSKVRTWPQQLAAGDEITCARMTDGSVYCCGSDTKGRLGVGRIVDVSPFFTKAEAFTHRAVQVATSDSAVCALVEDGSVECWGSNEKGELGMPRDEADHPSPVKIVF